ncbi:MAG: hypothetical protein IJL76_03045 [Bacilli bacterium]|nr:hypothetical protein [Bacilli bacterium]
MRILSLFDCPLKDITNVIPIIKEQGFDAVQISPLQETKEEGSEYWWNLYQPINFEIGNRIGSKEDLRELCDVANYYGVYVVADTVVNHLASDNNQGSLTPHPNCDPEILNNKDCWKEKIQVTDWYDRYQVTHYCMSLPGLNPNNKLVQEKIINMLNEYIDLGVDGFRFDAAKSIALPEEGCDFFKEVTYNLNRWLPVVYGEVLFSNDEEIRKYAQYMKVLTTNDVPDYLNDSVIKFIENKDSFLSGELGWTKNWKTHDIIEAYKDLNSRYENTLYYARNYTDDWFEWMSPSIKEANKVKRR